jgi:hypothetical protein
MKTAQHNSGIGGLHLVIALAAMAAVLAVAPAAHADPPVVVTGSADIKVWVDQPWDVYSSYDDVVVSVHAARGCYVAVFLIDTHGFVHVIRPSSPYESAWIRGGITYRFSGHALGLDAIVGRGIAHVFAVGSPRPFDFAPYGEAIFVGRYGYRIEGDPYLAFRELYVPILPASCRWDFVRVGSARFYVREWARYPIYLCRGSHGGSVHVRVGGNCGQCYTVYHQYREHVNDPYQAVRPAPKRYKAAHSADRTPVRVRKTKDAYKVIHGVYKRGPKASQVRSPKIVSAKRTGETVDRVKRTQKTTKSAVKVSKRASKNSAVVKTQTKTTGRVTKTKATKGRVSK